MGISIRYFLVDNEDNVKSISIAKIERLQKGDPGEKYPELKNEKIKLAEIYVEFDGRKPIRVIQIHGSFLSFDSNGMLDQEEIQKEMHAGVGAAIQIDLQDKNKKIINAEKVFASKMFQNKYKWSLNDELKQKILKAIFGYK